MSEVNMDTLRRIIREEYAREQAAQPSETHVQHCVGCPDCYCSIIEELNKTSDYACANCGLPLGNKEFVSKIPKCPNCGHESVQEVRR